MIGKSGLCVIFKEDGNPQITNELLALSKLEWWVAKETMVGFWNAGADDTDRAKLSNIEDRVYNVV